MSGTAGSGPVSPPAARWSSITVRFAGRAALQGVDLEVRPGEFVVVAGPNGSGKSTLLRVMLGLLSPDEGRVELFGTAVGSLSIRERARRVAWVPQEEAVRDDPTVREYVAYGRYAYQAALEGESDGDRREVEEALRELELTDRAGDGIQSLSGGERQRAVLGRALAQATPLLLLDEPTTHLDIGHQLDLLERVRRLSRSHGKAVVAALHDLNLAARFADRVVILSRGRKYDEGPPEQVLSEDLLARVWGVVADLRRDARTGVPYLLPHRRVAATDAGRPEPGYGPVHVVGGGGAAAPLLRALSDEGFRLSAGALHLLDTDAEVAEALGIPIAAEVPFAPLGDEARATHRALLDQARVIVVAPFAVGPSNLANLLDVVDRVPRIPTLLVARPPIERRDFADGEGRRAWQRLREAGAREVPTVDDAVAAVRVIAGEAAPPSAGRPRAVIPEG